MVDQPPLPKQPAGAALGAELEVRISSENAWFGGEVFSDWTSLEVHRSLFSAAGSFKINTAHRRPWPMRPDTGVAVSMGGEPVLSGYVDALNSSVTGEAKSLSFAGRDNTAVLADCSHENEPGEWHNLTVREIVTEICTPFGIEVSAKGLTANNVQSLDLVYDFRVQPGEKAWTAIDRLLRLRGYLAFSPGNGALRITRLGDGDGGGEVIEGPAGNVLASKIVWSHVSRHSIYKVRGQAVGGDDGWGTLVIQPEGSALDDGVHRFRPLTVLAEGQIDSASADTRAEWEATYRAAKAASCKVTVQGWKRLTRDGEARLWQVNETVWVEIPSQGLRQRLLVDDLVFKRSDDGGTTTTMNLVRRDAYNPKPKVATDKEPFADLLGEL